MSKRPYEESVTPGTLPSEQLDNPGRLPINDLLSLNEQPQEQHESTGHVKKQRNFIASVACETCRLKKTRCDESRPKCGLCKALGLDCVYNERKSSKKDQNLSLIMSTLHRLESKLEDLPSAINHDLQHQQGKLHQAANGRGAADQPAHGTNDSMKPASVPAQQYLSPETGDSAYGKDDERLNGTTSTGQVSISFSQHMVILWPGAREILPESILKAHETLGKNYVIDLETRRPPLPMHITPYPIHAGESWLETLPLTMIEGLSDAFFTTFNPFTPIMDKNFYFAYTLPAAVENGFGYTMQTCLVLNVLALGCLAVHAHHEGNYPLPGSQSDIFEPPEWMNIILEQPSGLRFFNEARRRIGFLMCGNDIQSCQFYLLSSVYYSQILRPLDWWAMIHRAATCCLSMLTNHDVNFDEWEGDMKSRVFWNCLMNESILVQELHLPPSGLARLEEFVPIPKFIGFKPPAFVMARFSSFSEVDDSYFQYHFLAQVAHRIILNRIRHSLYFYSDSGTWPLPAINTELHHQLEQWRINLPPAIQFPDFPPNTPVEATAPSPSHPTDLNRPLTPATAVTEAMLRGRYMIAKFHIGRPYLYKALRRPTETLTEDDLDQVRSGLRNAMDWPIVQGIFRRIESCVPIRFAFCSQFFGQILLFYCISHSPHARLRETLPVGWERWNAEMVRFLEDCAPHSPAVARDLELLRLLS